MTWFYNLWSSLMLHWRCFSILETYAALQIPGLHDTLSPYPLNWGRLPLWWKEEPGDKPVQPSKNISGTWQLCHPWSYLVFLLSPLFSLLLFLSFFSSSPFPLPPFSLSHPFLFSLFPSFSPHFFPLPSFPFSLFFHFPYPFHFFCSHFPQGKDELFFSFTLFSK